MAVTLSRWPGGAPAEWTGSLGQRGRQRAQRLGSLVLALNAVCRGRQAIQQGWFRAMLVLLGRVDCQQPAELRLRLTALPGMAQGFLLTSQPDQGLQVGIGVDAHAVPRFPQWP